MPTMWKNKMIEKVSIMQILPSKKNDFIETRVENLEPKEDKKISSAVAKKSKKFIKKTKWKDSDSSVVESSKESTEACRPSKKYCVLHGKYSYSTDSFKDLRVVVNKHKQKKKKSSTKYGKRNKELNALIEEKFQKFVKNKKKRKTEKKLQHFQKMQIFDNESKKSVSSVAESVESGEITLYTSE